MDRRERGLTSAVKITGDSRLGQVVTLLLDSAQLRFGAPTARQQLDFEQVQVSTLNCVKRGQSVDHGTGADRNASLPTEFSSDAVCKGRVPENLETRPES